MTRQLTWESECEPHVRYLDGGGDTALCFLWDLLDPTLAKIQAQPGYDEVAHRVFMAGNLRTPLGISWLLRGLLLYPQVRRVYLLGHDLMKTGEVFSSLFLRGRITLDHRVPHYGWKLDSLIETRWLHSLFQSVVVYNATNWSPDEILEHLQLTPMRAPVRVPVELPPVELPEFVTLPSRRTTTTLHTDSLGDGWLKAVQSVLRLGDVRKSRKGEQLRHTFHVTVEFPVEPTLTLPCCLDVTQGQVEAYLAEFFAREKAGSVDYGYGERLQNWRGHDQLAEIIERLRKEPDTKRASIALLDAADLSTLEDAPCLATVTYAVQDGALYGSAVYRSHDMYAGWPLNVIALTELQRRIAADLNVGTGRLTVVSQNAQIYERHWKAAQEKLEQYFGRKPGIALDPAGAFVFSVVENDGQPLVTAQLTSVAGDQVLWETTERNPELLVRRIVHEFPWLDLGHAVYLGTEAQKLKDALRGHSTYRQG